MRKLVFNRAADAEPTLVTPPGAGDRVVYLFHHCVATEDEANEFGGWTDSSLTELGRTQAQLMLDFVMSQNITVGKLWSSDLPRATQTADFMVACAVDKVVTQTRRARSWGIGSEISGHTKTDQLYKDAKRFYVEHPDTVPPGQDAETLNQSKARWMSFLMYVFSVTPPGQANGIVAHGNNIKNTCQMLGFGKKKIGHGAVSRLTLGEMGDMVFEVLYVPAGADIGAEDDDILRAVKSGKAYRCEMRYSE